MQIMQVLGSIYTLFWYVGLLKKTLNSQLWVYFRCFILVSGKHASIFVAEEVERAAEREERLPYLRLCSK
jgi:hypothetical protein